MTWSYAPAAVLTIDSDDATTTSSGVFIADERNQKGYIVTCANMTDEVYATIETFITDNKVQWAPVKKTSSINLHRLEKVISQFKSSYDFEPSYHDGDGPKITVLSFNPKALRQALQTKLTPFTIASDIGDRVQFHCCPFATVNPALFMGYKTQGNVTYANQDVVFSDVKYLDGMNGGIVFKEGSNSSVGLVVGKLKKRSKEGELTVVVPWRLIRLPHTQIVSQATSGSSSSGEMVKRDNEWNGVVAITVTRKNGGVLWGSGVLIAPNVVVTNAHVVDDHRSLTGWFSRTQNVQLEYWGAPVKGIDLAFLRLKSSPEYPPPVKLCHEPLKVGEAVKSVGYGLFYPHTFDLTPLVSTGSINRVVSLPLTDHRNSIKTPVIIVASAGCWNGSSGGALLNTKGELVGIMASNGKLSSGEIIPTMTFAIPVYQLVDYAWKLIEQGKSVEASYKVGKMWRLEQTHEHATLREESKL